MRDLRNISMRRGITDTKLPPRYNPEFIFPDKDNPLYDALNYTGGEMMVGGPAGTGKTHACVMKAHKMACMYPNSVGVFIRKVKESIKNTIIPTYYDVLGYDPMQTEGYVKGIGGTRPQEFHYQNGSTIFCIGMSDPKQLDSLQTDWFYVNQAEELDESEWQILNIRNRGIRMPYRIVYGDCNPSFPEHFLCPYEDNPSRREGVYYLPTLHIHNPLLFYRGEQQPMWDEYVEEVLANLKGLERDRYYDGRWVYAEGAVFKDFDRRKHVSKKQWRKGDFGGEWKWYRAIDYGATSPNVCQLWAVKDREHYWLVNEIYKTQLEAYDFYDMIMDMTAAYTDLETVKWTVADHDGHATMSLEKKEKQDKKFLRLRKAEKHGQRKFGRIELQKTYYASDKIKYNLDTLWHEKDETLLEKGLPYCTPMEIGRYVYPEDKKGTKHDDTPVKGNDHGIDAQGYFVDEENGYQKPYKPLVKSVKNQKRKAAWE